MIRLAVWNLRDGWDGTAETGERLSTVSGWLGSFGDWNAVEAELAELGDIEEDLPLFSVREDTEEYGAAHADIPF